MSSIALPDGYTLEIPGAVRATAAAVGLPSAPCHLLHDLRIDGPFYSPRKALEFAIERHMLPCTVLHKYHSPAGSVICKVRGPHDETIQH